MERCVGVRQRPYGSVVCNTCHSLGPILGLPGLKKSQGIFPLISICLCPHGSHRGTPLPPEKILEDFRFQTESRKYGLARPGAQLSASNGRPAQSEE